MKPIKVNKGAFKDVGSNQECLNKINGSGDKVLECGHPCKGFYNEEDGLPCLDPECVEENPEATLDENNDSYCSIGFISGLGDSPSIQLGCKHIFHVEGIAEKIRQKWAGPRITFLFKTCPSCKADIEAPHHPEINQMIEEACKLEDEIKAKALERAKVEGLDKDPRLNKAGDEYYKNLEKYAMARLSYYSCHKCQSPFFGGLKDCGNQLEAAPDFNPAELICGKGASETLGGQVKCMRHGTDYIEYKCRYCGSLSQWFCFGTTHFGDPCHKIAGRNVVKKCPGKDKCGLNVDHPDNGEEFALGCGLCRHSADD